MKLTVLGKYGPFSKAGGGTSSYLFQGGGKNILLDAGEGSFSRLCKFIEPNSLDAIILTHSHYDHICDVGIYGYYFESLLRKDKSAYKPVIYLFNDKTPYISAIANMPFFTVRDIYDGMKTNIGDLLVEFIAVKHPVPCYAVKISDGNKKFVYTGDTNVFDGLEKLVGGADTFLADGCFLHRDWAEDKPHLSVKMISELTKKCGNRAIISHLNPLYDELEIEAEIKNCHGNASVADEGKTYEL